MRISTEINSISNLVGEEKAVELVAKAGFDCFDLSMFKMCGWDWGRNCLADAPHPFNGDNYLAFVRRLKQIGLDNGITCNQSHAPFPVNKPKIRGYLKRAIECTAEAGGKICIIHPDNDLSPEKNAEMYFELLPFAKDHGVKIATENMWNWNTQENCAGSAACSGPESFNAHLDAVNDEFFVACLDIGHAEMRGLNTTAPEMIRALGQRLGALHIHDNDRHRDLHAIPFSMDIDWNEVIKALKEIDYKGDFTLEADSHMKKFTAENALEGVKELAESARRLVDMFEKA